jgi:hypothetical protein
MSTSHWRFLVVFSCLSVSAVSYARNEQPNPPRLKRQYRADLPPLSSGPLVTTTHGSHHLDETHYRSVRDATLTMMKRYPPGDHYYVALGRSPVSIFTFLHTLDPNMAATFPASDLRFGISPQLEGDFFKHFEKYIPAEVLRGDRGDIVLFDRSHDRSGTSLATLKPILEKYLATKGYKTKVKAVGFAGAGPLQPGVDFIDTQPFPQVFLYFNGADHDENVATYVGHHTIGTHNIDNLQSNPEHETFVQGMKNRMSRDTTLDAALMNEPHLREHVRSEKQ